MIHIAIGTKAQFIKMAPIMQKLQEERIQFNLIDLGQHSRLTEDLREEFKIKEPDVYLARGENISRLSRGILWLLKIFFKSLSGRWVREKIFLRQKGICLIHGDTASTLLGLYLAKRAGLKVAHVEAGLRSGCFREPFPEEILRVLAMHFSDILFCPSAWAYENLKKMGLKDKAVLLSNNTSLESLRYSLNKKVEPGLRLDKFCLVTVHRMENIFFRKRMEFVLELIEEVSGRLPVVFVQHAPTINQLAKFGMQEKLNQLQNIHYFKILSHAHFIALLEAASFLLTDGGSIQEEAYYLNKPCLLLRRYTERNEGLGENATLCGFDKAKADYFIKHYLEFRRRADIPAQTSAAGVIAAAVKAYV